MLALKEKTQGKSTLQFIPAALVCSLLFSSVPYVQPFGTIFLYIYIFFFSWLRYTAHGILVPPPGMEPTSLALEAWNPNHNQQGSPWNCLQWFCPDPNTQSHKY